MAAVDAYPIRLTPAVPVYRGDELRFSVAMQGGDPLEPVDLLLFGDTFTAQARSTRLSGTAVDLDVDTATGIVGGELQTLYLSLTGEQTAALARAEYGFDVQVTGGTVDPITIFAGTLSVSGEYTRPDPDES